MTTSHIIYYQPSQKMTQLSDSSIDLVVTSPPYPMIEMWDNTFSSQTTGIDKIIKNSPEQAWEMMHRQLDNIWRECYRVMKPGAFLCINIGDATRTLDGNFRLFNNHTRIISACQCIGFTTLPNIIWRKQTNAPNKFMGSGMLPCGAYVTLEHEWILIFRKGSKRLFSTDNEKSRRMKSSYFWEERNIWFSDLWEIKGTKQRLNTLSSRERSGAYPLEIPSRLINMFSQKGDIILDPFAGTGTTSLAAIKLGRNSVGFEIDSTLRPIIDLTLGQADIDGLNADIKSRVDNHVSFVEQRKATGKEVKYFNRTLNVSVMTKQEVNIEFQYIRSIDMASKPSSFEVTYEDKSDLSLLPSLNNLFSYSFN